MILFPQYFSDGVLGFFLFETSIILQSIPLEHIYNFLIKQKRATITETLFFVQMLHRQRVNNFKDTEFTSYSENRYFIES